MLLIRVKSAGFRERNHIKIRICYLKEIVAFFSFFSFFISVVAQNKKPGKKLHHGGKSNMVSVGINRPPVNFSNTHIVGIGTENSNSNHRFGRMEVKPVKSFSFIANSGVAYYI